MEFTRDELLEKSKIRLQNEAIKVKNETGYQIDIDTLTGIKSEVTTQKFYEVKPSDYLPVVVGENAFMDSILTWKEFDIGSDFETGIIETGSNRKRLEEVDAQIDSVRVPVKYWAKAINYNIVEVAQASKTGNWSLIENKERARLRNWQLGIQKTAFLGLQENGVNGLLTMTSVASNTTTITKKLIIR